MFKYRFSKWGIKTGKKTKDSEARAFLLQSHDDRVPTVGSNARQLDMKRVLKYYRRKKVAIEDVINSNPTSSIDSISVPSSQQSFQSTSSSPNGSPQAMPHSIALAGLEIDSPATYPPKVPLRLESPDCFKAAEAMLATISEYFRGSLKSGAWVNVGMDKTCLNMRRKTPGVYIGEFFQKINLAASLYDSVDPTMADKTLSDALDFVPVILEKQASNTMTDLIRLVAELFANSKHQIVSQLCRRLSTTSTSYEVELDPLTSMFRRIFAYLSGLLRDYKSGQVLSSAIHAIMDIFGRELGVCHMETIFATRDFISVLRSVSGTDNFSQPLDKSYRACVTSTGRDSLQSVNLLLELARIERLEKKFALAGKHAEEGISFAKRFLEAGNDTTVRLLLDAYWISGQAHDMLGAHSVVEKRYRQAVQLNMREYGSDNWSTKRDRTVLWRWLMDQKRCVDAAQVKFEGPLLS